MMDVVIVAGAYLAGVLTAGFARPYIDRVVSKFRRPPVE